MMKSGKIAVAVSILAMLITNVVLAQHTPTRVGTTTASFLEFGYGSAGIAMGDACVSTVNDVSAIYWNPAGLAFMSQSEAQFVHQPWLVDINSTFAGVGAVLPGLGTIALGFIHVGYGDMQVTTMDMQEGTGELFSVDDYAISLGFARRLTNWFSFGAAVKYITSSIWHMEASAFALDMGVIVKTPFFAPSDDRNGGLRVGMSISNYGSRMQYDGQDLTNPIDILPNEGGNFKDTPGKFDLTEWELPLIFRIGISYDYHIMNNHIITLSTDALHPNNTAEYINFGAQYALTEPSFGKFFLRGGYNKLLLPDSQFGLTLGAGFEKHFLDNLGIRFDYAYREVGVLGKVNSYTIGLLF
jgi:hypothetical protein